MKCLTCSRMNKSGYQICISCRKNPFKVEDSRKILSSNNNLKGFLETYSRAYSQIENKNTKKFWNGKFSRDELLSEQDEMTKDKINFIVNLLPKRTIKILDLGIGQGYLEQKLKKLDINHAVSGVDISVESIHRARSKFDGTFYIGDVLKVKKLFKENSFDVIVAIEVIEHIQPRNILYLYKAVRSLLKPNGMIIFSTPLNEGLSLRSKNPSAHVRAYSVQTIIAELKISNFEVTQIKHLVAFKQLYQLKKMLSKLLPLWKPNNVVVVARKI